MIFIATDWRNLEGRLTAYFSEDPVLQSELDAELQGGPKVHSLNASLITGCDPFDAKNIPYILQGVPKTAYDAGKRLTHAWNYGMKTIEMARQFWISKDEATRISSLLASKYKVVVQWRKNLSEHVVGREIYQCMSCGSRSDTYTGCCNQNMRRIGFAKEPARILYTPFRRRRLYLGRKREAENPLYSQLPQSTGASMFYRTMERLQDILCPAATFDEARTRGKIYLATGTYDSFLIAMPKDSADACIPRIKLAMEAPWPQLPLCNRCPEHVCETSARILRACPSCETSESCFSCPADFELGSNWGKLTTSNPSGLKELAS